MEERKQEEVQQNQPLGEKESTFEKMNNFVNDNRKLIMGISIGVIAAVILIFVIKSILEKNSAEKREKAETAISRILPFYQACIQGDSTQIDRALNGDPQFKVRGEDIIGLNEIVKRYEGINTGKVAALYAGNLYLMEKKADVAEKYFKIALDADPKLVLEGANAGLGVAKEMQGKIEEAISYYDKAVKYADSYGSKSRYEYFSGLLYEQNGKKDQAEKTYRAIIGENKSGEFVMKAKAGLTRLGIIIE